LECRIFNRELVDTAIKRCVNILCVQETKWTGQKTKEVERYIGKEQSRNVVGILINKRLKNEVVTVRRQENNIIMVKLVIRDLILCTTNRFER
jgi:exonuclease III